MTARVVGDLVTVRGLGFAGIEGAVVETAAEARAAIHRFLDEKNVGIVLVAQSFADQFGAEFDAYKLRRKFPLVMTIPAYGVDALLRLCDGDLKRGEDLMMAFDLGTRFSNEGITTNNTTSGISASVSHPSTIVGSRYDLLKLQPPAKISTWGKIKILFQ